MKIETTISALNSAEKAALNMEVQFMHGNGVSCTHKIFLILAESELKVPYLPKNLKIFRA